jgi:hypothetical protein
VRILAGINWIRHSKMADFGFEYLVVILFDTEVTQILNYLSNGARDFVVVWKVLRFCEVITRWSWLEIYSKELY